MTNVFRNRRQPLLNFVGPKGLSYLALTGLILLLQVEQGYAFQISAPMIMLQRRRFQSFSKQSSRPPKSPMNTQRVYNGARRVDSGKCNCAASSADEEADICRRTLDGALGKMAEIGEVEFASTFNQRRIRAVEVKESSIAGAGLGLFVKNKAIKAGTIVSFYPAHTLGIDLGHSIRKVSRDALGITKEHEQQGDEERQEGGRTTTSEDETYLHHILGTRALMGSELAKDLGAESLFVDVDLSQTEWPGFSSHRINDGATVTTNSEEGVLDYYQASRLAKNCVTVPFGPSPLLATITTKKVPPGSELLTTYGCSYWLGPLNQATGEEETDMTPDIIGEAKGVAMDVFQGMKNAALRHANEAKELQDIFHAT
mmetsp:Transcript_17973/g.48870  ORF Transcript_17973/g.48870 Transcript_17973/m.48870 type:complete len:371 (-) Transcript_17973:68-1180(-)|eukprot:CAMPEP_0168722404 /NCGR_PEP_ID=MMETSP0724-20121128/2581_1 /TAXON_ID=265536 /ORGANISM="Amphiprora sp., Strain CCMP467" /LENGTH=370 /DNA_ID=CAMNT_0008769077 /DNA_START=305 /DNA_END=1417 /DNA_ORIENTATION=-